MRQGRQRGVSTLLALLIAGGVALPTGMAEGSPIPNDGLGMVHLAVGQTARLNVVNVAGVPVPNDGRPCQVELMFHDSMGNPIGRAVTVELGPKQGAFLELSFEDIPVPGGRVGIIPCAMPVGARTPRRGCAVVPTVELYNQETMQTILFFGLTPVLSAPPERESPAP